MQAAEVASDRRDGIGLRPRMEMEKRFLLYRVYMLCDDSAIDQAVKGPVPVFPHPAQPPFAGGDYTPMAAETAFYLSVTDFFIKQCFFHSLCDQGKYGLLRQL